MRSNKEKAFLRRFGLNLKRIREKKGLSLRELSYLCDIDNSKISKMEQGSVNVTLRTVLHLSEALEIHPYDLLHFDKD
jgi:transcriptional regulator with XRE-family HTH domain